MGYAAHASQRERASLRGMSRPLLKFSGGSVHDYATFSTAGFSQLTNHGTPNRSTSLPNRSAQKVSAMGICTVPPSASALKMRSASTASFGLSLTNRDDASHQLSLRANWICRSDV